MVFYHSCRCYRAESPVLGCPLRIKSTKELGCSEGIDEATAVNLCKLRQDLQLLELEWIGEYWFKRLAWFKRLETAWTWVNTSHAWSKLMHFLAIQGSFTTLGSWVMVFCVPFYTQAGWSKQTRQALNYMHTTVAHIHLPHMPPRPRSN